MVTVQLSRQYVVDLLRKVGMPDLAEEARHVLPDPVDREDVAAWGERHGVSLGELINRMGGSP